MQRKAIAPNKLVQERRLKIASPNDLAPWDAQIDQSEEELTISNHIVDSNLSEYRRAKNLSSSSEFSAFKSERVASYTRFESMASKPREKFSGHSEKVEALFRAELNKSASRGNVLSSPHPKNATIVKKLGLFKDIEGNSKRYSHEAFRQQRYQIKAEMLDYKNLPKVEPKTSQSATNLHKSSETLKMAYFNQLGYVPNNYDPKLSNSHIRQQMNIIPHTDLFYKPQLFNRTQFIIAPKDSKFHESNNYMGSKPGVSINYSDNHRRRLNENQFIQNRRMINSESSPAKEKSQSVNNLNSLSSEIANKTLIEIKNATSRNFSKKGDVYSKIQVENLMNKVLNQNIRLSPSTLKASSTPSEIERKQEKTLPKLRTNLRSLVSTSESPNDNPSKIIRRTQSMLKASAGSIQGDTSLSNDVKSRANLSKEREIGVAGSLKELNYSNEFSDATFVLPISQQQRQIRTRGKIDLFQLNSNKSADINAKQTIRRVKARKLVFNFQKDGLKIPVENASQHKLFNLFK